ncbi:MAG: hypothetical protein K8W52_25465 [Deltaproteobacteria bacterium]|nr:hypothetical protein [Deltaproteobacteria bacterium]
MRRLVLALLLASAAVAPAAADTPIAPGAITPDDAPPAVDPSLLKASTMKTPEILNEKPSGFWTSNRPAKDGAYYYWMMGIGIAVSATAGLIALIVIRRAGRQPAPTA